VRLQHGARITPHPQGAQQQTRRPPLLLSIDGTDGRTDRHNNVALRYKCGYFKILYGADGYTENHDKPISQNLSSLAIFSKCLT